MSMHSASTMILALNMVDASPPHACCDDILHQTIAGGGRCQWQRLLSLLTIQLADAGP